MYCLAIRRGFFRFCCLVWQGAENLVLEGVFHSMTTDPKWPIDHRWYGSEDVVDRWLHSLLRAPSSAQSGVVAAATGLAPESGVSSASSVGERDVTAALEAAAAAGAAGVLSSPEGQSEAAELEIVSK